MARRESLKLGSSSCQIRLRRRDTAKSFYGKRRDAEDGKKIYFRVTSCFHYGDGGGGTPVKLTWTVHSDEGLTLETSVFESLTVANLPYRPCG